jgi:hypothetical protein
MIDQVTIGASFIGQRLSSPAEEPGMREHAGGAPGFLRLPDDQAFGFPGPRGAGKPSLESYISFGRALPGREQWKWSVRSNGPFHTTGQVFGFLGPNGAGKPTPVRTRSLCLGEVSARQVIIVSATNHTPR